MPNRFVLRTLVVGALSLTSVSSLPHLAGATSKPSPAEQAAISTDSRARLTIPAADAAEPMMQLASKSTSPVPEVLEQPSPPAFESGRVAFSLRFQGLETSLATISAFVLPAATLEIEAAGGHGAFDAKAVGGTLASTGPSSWKWTAPSAHGHHEILFRQTSKTGSVEQTRLHVFVLHPYDGGDRVGEYRVGRYRPPSKTGSEAYTRPQGFVEVTPEILDVQVSPHFRLGQFLCKAQSEWPKYVALRTPLLLKLEMLMQELAERGYPAKSLHVMSGFRTPAYNSGIGNETTYSRHTYGDAADVFLDRDEDGRQDDLNGDGKSTREDSRILYELVESVLDDSVPGQMAGGLSAYGPNSAHGPFLHIDARGHRARW